MIALATFAEAIESALNANTQGINFRIFADAGQYEKAFKDHTEKKRYTNGLIRVKSSAIVPVQGMEIATQQVSLELCAPLYDAEKDEEIAAAHRAILDAVFSQFTVQPIPENGKTYSVSTTYSLANTGTVQQRPPIGTSITFDVGIEYAYIENGLNSYDCVYELDGVVIPYTNASIGKVATTENNSYADTSGESLCFNTAFARSFDFQIPAQSKGIGAQILGELLGNDLNTVHTLTMRFADGGVKTYKVIYASSDMNVQGVDNAGHNVSFVEARDGEL